MEVKKKWKEVLRRKDTMFHKEQYSKMYQMRKHQAMKATWIHGGDDTVCAEKRRRKRNRSIVYSVDASIRRLEEYIRRAKKD